MINKLTFLLILLTPLFSNAQCSLEDYQIILNEAKVAQNQGLYDVALNKLFAARVCRPEKDEEIKVKILAVFSIVNKQKDLAEKSREETKKQRDVAIEERNKSERKTRENYANDLVYKSKSSLSKGDITSAFRFLLFANQYADSNNQSVNEIFTQLLTYNKNNYPPKLFNNNLLDISDDFRQSFFYLSEKYIFSFTSNNIRKLWGQHSISDYWELQATSSGMLNIFDIATGDNIHSIAIDTVESLCISPNGTSLALGNENSIKIMHIINNKHMRTLSDWYGGNLTFSDDGSLITGNTSESEISIWRISDGKKIDSTFIYCAPSPFGGAGNDGPVLAINPEIHAHTFSKDKKYFACIGSNDGYSSGAGIVNLYDIQSDTIIAFDGKDYYSSIAFSPSGKYLIAGSDEGVATVWSLEDMDEVIEINCEKPITSIAFSHNDSLLATGFGDGEAIVWKIKEEDESFSSNLPQNFSLIGHSMGITSLTFLPQSNHLVTASRDKFVKIWEINAHKNFFPQKETPFFTNSSLKDKIAILYLDTIRFYLSNKELPDKIIVEQESTELIKMSPDGKLLAIVTNNSNIIIFRLDDYSKIATLAWSNRKVDDIYFSFNGNYVAIKSDEDINIWNFSRPASFISLTGSALTFSPITNTISVCSNSNMDILHLDKIDISRYTNFDSNYPLDFNPESEIHTYIDENEPSYYNSSDNEKNNAPINCAVFSPDGNRLTMGLKSGVIKTIEMSNNKTVFILKGHDGQIDKITYSDSGIYLATHGSDNCIKIWNLKIGIICNVYCGLKDKVSSIHFSKNEAELIITTNETTIIWILKFNDWLQSEPAKKFTVANFNQMELEKYNLVDILNVMPDNESKLINSGEISQISSFADIYYNKISQTGFPNKDDFDRALRLYSACLTIKPFDEKIQKKITNLKTKFK